MNKENTIINTYIPLELFIPPYPCEIIGEIKINFYNRLIKTIDGYISADCKFIRDQLEMKGKKFEEIQGKVDINIEDENNIPDNEKIYSKKDIKKRLHNMLIDYKNIKLNLKNIVFNEKTYDKHLTLDAILKLNLTRKVSCINFGAYINKEYPYIKNPRIFLENIIYNTILENIKYVEYWLENLKKLKSTKGFERLTKFISKPERIEIPIFNIFLTQICLVRKQNDVLL